MITELRIGTDRQVAIDDLETHTIMGSREFHVEGRLLQCKDGKSWEPLPQSPPIQRLSILCCVVDGSTHQLHLNVTSISGGPTKILVPDLASPAFRHKIVQEQFVQWRWGQEALLLRCRSSAEAHAFSEALVECGGDGGAAAGDGGGRMTTTATTMPSRGGQGARSMGSLHGGGGGQMADSDLDGMDGRNDEDKPLSRVGLFQPQMRRAESLKRQSSGPHLPSSSSLDVSSSSLVRLLENIRQESKREREEVLNRLSAIERLLELLLETKKDASPGSPSTPTPNENSFNFVLSRPSVAAAASPQLRQSPAPSTVRAAVLNAPPPPPPGPPMPPSVSTPLPPPPPSPSLPPSGKAGLMSNGGGPPPPPPPPPPVSVGKGMGSLADQLQAAKLKKSGSEQHQEVEKAAPKKATLDFSSELQNKIRKRSAMNTDQ